MTRKARQITSALIFRKSTRAMLARMKSDDSAVTMLPVVPSSSAS